MSDVQQPGMLLRVLMFLHSGAALLLRSCLHANATPHKEAMSDSLLGGTSPGLQQLWSALPPTSASHHAM